jgi:hypothetical protein
MSLERPTLLSFLAFFSTILVFVFAGALWGWRAVGVVSLIGAIAAWREGRVGVGWDGEEPSFYLTGRAAQTAVMFGVLLSLFLIFFPHVLANLGR